VSAEEEQEMNTHTSVRSGTAAIGLIALLDLLGCGGGGGAAAPPNPPPPAPTFSIGGTTTGLNGTVVLQQNAAKNLSVAANGAFTFPGTVASGAAYAVTVLTNPAGQRCSVTSGAGNAAANVTSVTVNCVNLYTIGGTVSGLTGGTVVLQNNAGDNLSIVANGNFTFVTTVASGDNYVVSVLTQPPGPDCVLSSASGMATNNVTSVAVICTVDPTTTFLPFVVNPRTTTGRPSEVHLVTSKSIARPSIRVADDFNSTIAFVRGASNPSAFLYSGTGPGNGGHVYALDLGGASSLVPRQLSNLTFPAANQLDYCEAWLAYNNLNDPGSGFLLLSTPNSSSVCYGDGTPFVRIRLTDSASTTPASVSSVVGGTKHFLYRPDGMLAGTLLVDTATHQLSMYHDDTFTSSTHLLDDCVNFMVVHGASDSMLGTPAADSTYAFIVVYQLDGSNRLFRIAHTRAISAELLNLQGEMRDGTASDDLYFYFMIRNYALPETQDLFRVRLDGTSPAQKLYSYSVPDGDTGLTLIGVVGSRLILARELTIDQFTGARSADIRTLDKSGPGTPTVIASFTESPVYVTLFKDRLFLEIVHVPPGSNSAPDYVTTSATEILNPDGSIVQPLLPNSSFIGFGPEALRRTRDIATNGDFTGPLENISELPGGSFQFTPLKQPDGSAFTLGESTRWTYSFLFGASNSVGSASGALGNYGLIIDENAGTAAVLKVPDKDVLFPLP
jgi:hypothetical protein